MLQLQEAPPKVKHRVNKSLKDVVHMVEKEIQKDMEEELAKKFTTEEEKTVQKSVIATWGGGSGLSKSLSRASNVGTAMIPKVIFPAAPKLFRDGWVLAEFLLTIIQFIYAFISTNYRVNRLFNAIYISLSSINFALSMIDGFYYFYELGSCSILLKKCKRCFRKKKEKDYEALGNDEESEHSDSEIEEEMNFSAANEASPRCLKVCRLSPKKKEQLNMWFEVVRSVLSELLLYPLVVLDLFGVISDPQISDRLNFSFFVIGSFYLVLSVYIARTMTLILTMLTLRTLLSGSPSGKKNIVFVIRFLFHSVAQIVVHLSCVFAVAIKILQENEHNGGHYHASPILWLVILGGWCIPFLGVITFFLVNYFWAQQFSVGFFVELMTLLQEGDVIETVVQGKNQTKAEADERSKKILEKMEFKKVKEEFKTVESASRFSKLSYPIKVPMYILLCVLYNVALGGFLACLLLTKKDGHIVTIPFTDFKGIALAVVAGVIALANIHLIVVTNATIFVFASVFLIVFFLPGFFAVPLFLVIMYIVRRSSQAK